jgi:hypothetical protein
MNIDPNLAHCNEEAARLLPWYVAGILAPLDMERVTGHLEQCGICRADVEHERSVRALLKSDARMEYAPQPGLSKTLERIDALDQHAAAAIPDAAARRPTRWLAAAVVLEAIALGLLGGYVYQRPAAQTRYGTLSSAAPAPSGPELRAVFASGTTLGELRALLAAQNLTIVGGPSDAGAYTLAATTPGMTRERLASTIAALRLDPRALFVEPVYDGRSSPP